MERELSEHSLSGRCAADGRAPDGAPTGSSARADLAMMIDTACGEPDRLLPLARGGDGEALGQLLELYRNYLMLMARLQLGRRIQGKFDAADLVQETFLEAHRDFAQFRGATERELIAWLRRIL